MRIKSLSWLMSAPLVVSSCIIGALYWGDGSGRFILILIPFIPLLAIYFGKDQIDYWYLQKYPYPLDQRIVAWLNEYDAYYLSLSDNYKKEYENRLSNYLFAREMVIMGNKETRELPEDIKAVIASQCVKITMGHEEYLLGDFDRIYCYMHPFPSPSNPALHLYETEKEDQMIILSMEHAIKGITDKKVFNIALQAYLEAYVSIYPAKDYPTVHDFGWTIPEQIFGLSHLQIQKYTGVEISDILAVHMNAYFTDREQYSAALPHVSASFKKIFNQ